MGTGSVGMLAMVLLCVLWVKARKVRSGMGMIRMMSRSLGERTRTKTTRRTACWTGWSLLWVWVLWWHSHLLRWDLSVILLRLLPSQELVVVVVVVVMRLLREIGTVLVSVLRVR